MQVNKSFLRLKFIKKRRKLYSTNFFFSFDDIFFLIKKNFSKKKPSIAGYYPSNFEVNILDLLSRACKKNFKVGLPVIKKDYKIDFKYWIPNEPLYVNNYGILEPKKQNITFKPDIILVPLVAFDRNLNRIGYGKGYYDRALKYLASKKKILTIGMAFSFQEASIIPTNQYDYNLDCILTNRNLIYRKKVNENFIFR
ncbi:MAG: 5-formyltetrahydrofolate cyclo-ligase [Pelagibacteraceae bacterium]|jgi:5-formyltetrahydrofolate cyclo-ligase|nr:5-formyltetrahydrofolate cyclo-ligase [Pelagibacteraceae bacterium]|tara:strand:+ start:4177 stop:4767 length:591 start_codon:yes stop_codon:yes gene_type:complete